MADSYFILNKVDNTAKTDEQCQRLHKGWHFELCVDHTVHGADSHSDGKCHDDHQNHTAGGLIYDITSQCT